LKGIQDREFTRKNDVLSGSRVGSSGDSAAAPDSRVLTSADHDWIPENGYDDPDKAVIAGLSMAKGSGSSEIEFGGAIVKIGDNYWFTEPVTQGLTHDFAANIIMPEGGTLAGIYHTHPKGSLSNIFSPHDVVTSHGLNVKSYIGIHQNSSIRYYDPSSMKPTRVSGIRNVSRGKELCSNCF
jgi:hypothetical protein